MQVRLVMGRGYWDYFRPLLKSLVVRTGHTLSLIGAFALAVFLFFSDELARHIQNFEWGGVSKWWALAPIGALVAYDLFVLNRETFRAVREDRDEIAKVIVNAQRFETWLLGLGKLRKEGVALRNRGPDIDLTEVAKYVADADDWSARAVDEVRRESPVDAILLDTLDWLEPLDWVGLNDEHALRMNVIHNQLKRIGAIIGRYAPDALPTMDIRPGAR